MLLGATFLAGNLGYISSEEVFDWFWPLLLVYLGISMLAGGKRGLFWGLATLGCGAVFLLQRFGIVGGEAWNYIWPGFLILAGLGLIFKPKKKESHDGAQNVTVGKLDHSTTFGEARYTVNTQAFEGGKVSASFSEVHVDLTTATMARDRVDLRIECTFGHVVVHTPAAWKIQMEMKTVAGGINDHRALGPQIGPTLVLLGDVTFGAVDLY